MTDLRAQSAEHSRGPDMCGTKGHKSYRDLKVWQRSIQLSVAVYRFTGEFPKAETYGLTSQLRRAAVSVASNIAEGYGRASKGEFRQFIGMARGSILELQTQLEIAKQLGFGSESLRSAAEGLAEETGKMTWALMQKL
jgi:four helix bundle protein